MSAVFADTSYFIALLNPKDAYHSIAHERTQSVVQGLVTTEWVLVELANYMCRAENRRLYIKLFEDLKQHPQVTIIPASTELFAQGVEHYKDRPDKDWSLTDCISFLVMEHEGLTAALTVDHHFEQSGFSILLK